MKAFVTCCSILACGAWSFVSTGSAHAEGSSPMGSYLETTTYCGHEPPERNATTIPWIGCFVLDAGHHSQGMLAEHQLETAVDETGHESFSIDGESIAASGVRPSASGTNSPFARPGGSGYRLCRDEGGNDCPASIDVFSRNADRSVLLMVSECLQSTGSRVCVMTQANWDYENARRVGPR